MPEPLKYALAEKNITRLAENLARVHASYDVTKFVSACLVDLDAMELKERVAHVAAQMKDFLPEKYLEALSVLTKAKAYWDRGDDDDSFSGFAAWPLFHFVETYGGHDFENSMATLKVLTPLFSAEFAVRVFIERYPQESFAELALWANDDDEHIRRLVSEGVRPRLPWAKKIAALIDDPAPVLGLLELLKDDPALFVRRSVANNLNDIAKDHPDVVIDLCERWLEHPTPERCWLVKHATRTLVKEGHPRIWLLLGFTKRPKVTTTKLVVDKDNVSLGGEIRFKGSISSASDELQHLAVDYAVHFMKANGKSKAKVFKLKVADLAPGASLDVDKCISFRAISTRKYYAGKHSIRLLVNGEAVSEVEFDVVPA
ncbi:MAG: DNA alkylation repair protein [Deltaproteobacteria bacterium]|nr:DNA alkylation repair protein [Deltaproteobacteria bacterium]